MKQSLQSNNLNVDSTSLLSVQNLSHSFGGLKALDQVSLTIHKNSLSGLIGPNGAGKTTFFNMLTGIYQPQQGEIIFNKTNLVGKKPHSIAQLGISRTFQNIRLFKKLTVLENILISSHASFNYSIIDLLIHSNNFKKSEQTAITHALDLLKLFELDHKQHEEACSLPYGEQRKLEIIRALATKPQFLLLDEPAAGMNNSETEELMKLILKIRNDFNLTILLIEHDMKLVMNLCEKIFVLDYGQKIAEGTALEVQTNKQVIEAYLGVEIE